MVELAKAKLGDVTINYDSKRVPVREKNRTAGPYPYYGASGIVDWVDGFTHEGLHLLIAEDGENLRTRQTPVAFLADGRFWVNNHAHAVTGESDSDTRFLNYALASTDISGYLTGSAMPKLSQRSLNAIVVPYPKPDLRRAIAGVLGSLDDKIEQNRRTAGKLEELARAVFRAWFVDFAPVHAKAGGATTYPGLPQQAFDALPTTFQDSPLGPIPEDWEVKSAVDVAKVAIGKTPPRKESQWFSKSPSDVRWISIANMKDCGVFISDTSEFLTVEAIEKFRVRRIPDRSVLFSFKLTVGRVAITDGETTSNEAIAHFVPKHRSTLGAEFLYCYLTSFDSGRLGSTSSIATATNSKAVKAMPVIVPSNDLAESFTTFANPLFESIRQIQRESRKLAELRDYLLPRLLSGAVRVSGASGGREVEAIAEGVV